MEAHSWTRRYFKMGKPKEMMIGFQADVSGLSGKDNWLEMYTGKDIAPGLFAWVIPCGDNTHRIGLWAEHKIWKVRALSSTMMLLFLIHFGSIGSLV